MSMRQFILNKKLYNTLKLFNSRVEVNTHRRDEMNARQKHTL